MSPDYTCAGADCEMDAGLSDTRPYQNVSKTDESTACAIAIENVSIRYFFCKNKTLESHRKDFV